MARSKRQTRSEKVLPDYELSSGDVFRDLGLADADELDIKANLAIKISQIIARRGLSQVKAAAVLGIDQPKVSAIVRGRLEKFSIERLCDLLTRLGCDVNIRVQERRKSARGRMRIQIAG
jgi:predicted XRE-type DNA-binding protein